MHCPVITEKHVADRWQVSLKTLRRWRLDGEGPVWHKLSATSATTKPTSRWPAAWWEAPPQLSGTKPNSHDLRTPLTSLAGFSGLLGREMGSGEAGERCKHYLARIGASVVQMSELIDALLKLARRSRISPHWDHVDLSTMAQTILNGYQEREPGRVTQLDIQPGLVVQGDPQLLRQVLENLLENAWTFCRQQTQPRIAFRRERSPDGEAVYAIQDNGVGFDMAYADKLFGAFQRLHTAAEFTGSGMGLATVQRIIARHGGRVWGESSPGHGATFCFTLGTPTPP